MALTLMRGADVEPEMAKGAGPERWMQHDDASVLISVRAVCKVLVRNDQERGKCTLPHLPEASRPGGGTGQFCFPPLSIVFIKAKELSFEAP